MAKKFSKLTNLCYEINGVAMDLQNRLDVDHAEDVYDRLFLAELELAGFKVTDKPKLKITDANKYIIKVYQPDFRVRRNGISVLVEIKADPDGLMPSYERKAWAYLSVSKQDRAILLINFAVKPLQWKRLERGKRHVSKT